MRLVVELTEAQHAALQARASSEGVSMSDLVRSLCTGAPASGDRRFRAAPQESESETKARLRKERQEIARNYAKGLNLK